MRELSAGAVVLLACAFGCHNDIEGLYGKQPTRGHADAGQDAPYQAALRIFGAGKCAQCAERKCEKAARTCAADMDCSAEAQCRTECHDPYCAFRCSDRLPDDARPTQALQQCIVAQCVDECEPGEDFACVGDYVRPAPEHAAVIVWSIALIRWNTEDRMGPGIRARLCRTTDFDCMKPLSEARSDANGLVKLKVPVEFPFGRPTPLNAYVEFVDPQSEPRVVPTIAFWGGNGAAEAPVESNAIPFQYPILTPEDQAAGAAFLGIDSSTVDSVAALAGRIYDCSGSDIARGAGVEIRASTANADTHVYYGSSLGVSRTFLDGEFLVGPLPLARATLTATHGDDAISVLDIVMRQNTNTGVFMFPTAR
jgi:hypothetical protein